MRETAPCCKAFCLSICYADLMASYDAWCACKKTFTKIDGEECLNLEDVHLVAPMVRPIGIFQEHPSTGMPYDKPTMLYRCVHLTSDGLCGIYERRPAVCRTYPKEGCDFYRCSRWSGAQCHDPIDLE